MKGKKTKKEQTWCCWTLSESDIKYAAEEVKYDWNKLKGCLDWVAEEFIDRLQNLLGISYSWYDIIKDILRDEIESEEKSRKFAKEHTEEIRKIYNDTDLFKHGRNGLIWTL
jgi:cupin superfamily acireductone dioxygenase involved in methionine salvage